MLLLSVFVFLGYCLKPAGLFRIALSQINLADFLIIICCILRNFAGQGKIEFQNSGCIQTGSKTEIGEFLFYVRVDPGAAAAALAGVGL